MIALVFSDAQNKKTLQKVQIKKVKKLFGEFKTDNLVITLANNFQKGSDVSNSISDRNSANIEA
ncbi:hypothetical protein [Mycoplasma amphoriforme]|uniref:hypothetical protein n=1 Tax=Mycoplasma amphoriforme TaxID=273136 RepID=UPI0031B9E612